MVEKWNVTLPELTGTEERRAYVYLPESYFYDTQKRYPVLYMFDGHNVFFDSDATYGKSWGMKEYMDYTNTQMIIAAVECNHSPNNGRLVEYTPFTFRDPKYGKIEGKGDLTMEWMINSFKPEIDRRYRTLSDRDNTFIAGSSLGGLMSLYAVLKYNHVFSRAAALSPSVWTNGAAIARIIDAATIEKGTIVYMDYGSREIKFHPTMENQFRKVTAQLLQKEVFVTSRIVPYGDHCEACWEKQLPFAIHTLLYNKY